MVAQRGGRRADRRGPRSRTWGQRCDAMFDSQAMATEGTRLVVHERGKALAQAGKGWGARRIGG